MFVVHFQIGEFCIRFIHNIENFYCSFLMLIRILTIYSSNSSILLCYLRKIFFLSLICTFCSISRSHRSFNESPPPCQTRHPSTGSFRSKLSDSTTSAMDEPAVKKARLDSGMKLKIVDSRKIKCCRIRFGRWTGRPQRTREDGAAAAGRKRR